MSRKYILYQLFFFVFLLVRSTFSNKLYLDSNNKFQDLLVFINDNVANTDGTLLNKIKEYMSSASKSLWTATSNLDPTKAGVQFGTVYIRVPESWAVDSIPITWQQCNTATFFVTKSDPNNKDSRPFTKQIGKCGDPGNFTRFPESFFGRENTDFEKIKAGKEIMNEFVKLRYGVFSEKPYRNVLTVFNGVTFINSTCGKDIEWKINRAPKKCIEPNSICNYTIIPNQSHNYSVMFDTESPESVFFCDDGKRPHNKYSKNLHNKICKRRSVTNVILSHKDFVTSQSPKPFQNVNFVTVKGQSRKIVLVLDTSGSMTGIIDNMKKATVKFLEMVEDSAEIGIVEFNSNGILRSDLKSMNIPNRNFSIGIIRSLNANGGTNIPHGLAIGVEVLGGHIKNDRKIFGSIILLTDGANNANDPYQYEYVINQLIKKGILVNAIAYGTAADSSLTKLTTGTGGKYYYSDPNSVFLELSSKLSAKQTCEISIDHEIKILEENVPINILDKVQTTNLTYIDKFIGTNLKLTITIPPEKSKYSITLIDPKGKRFSAIDRTNQASGLTITFHIPGIPIKGMYRIELATSLRLRYKRSTETFTLSFTISAKPEAKNSRIINPTGELSLSEIEMLSDETVVQATVDLTTCGILKEEQVTVYLIMTTPTKANVLLNMTDDGIGDDAIEDDKIFTKTLFAKDLKDIGFYSFLSKVEIKNTVENDLNSIKRTVELGSLRVKGKPPTIQDKNPPSQIEDLILNVYNNKRIIHMKFTAPGNDGMQGNISRYEVRINSSTIVTKIVNITVPPREEVRYPLDVENDNITNPFEVSIRGIDDKNNMAEWSLPFIYTWNYTAISESFETEGNTSGKLLVSYFYIIVCLFVLFH